jgi:hypothetical protein
MSFVEMTQEESKKADDEAWSRLESGRLFSLGSMEYFIAVQKASRDKWVVIPLDAANCGALAADKVPQTRYLSRTDARAIDLH